MTIGTQHQIPEHARKAVLSYFIAMRSAESAMRLASNDLEGAQGKLWSTIYEAIENLPRDRTFFFDIIDGVPMVVDGGPMDPDRLQTIDHVRVIQEARKARAEIEAMQDQAEAAARALTSK